MPSEPIPAQQVREELKPCPNPWCFSRTRPVPISASLNAGTSTYWRVQCACGIQTFRHDSQAEAVAEWNTRTPSEPIRVDGGDRGWRDIAKAPKDGTVIDLWLNTGRRLSDVRYDAKLRAWTCDKGPAEPYEVPGHPTHWMPLAAAPGAAPQPIPHEDLREWVERPMTKRERNILDNLRRRAQAHADGENRPAWKKDRQREADALKRALALLSPRSEGEG